jgi:hypothetical protein
VYAPRDLRLEERCAASMCIRPMQPSGSPLCACNGRNSRCYRTLAVRKKARVDRRCSVAAGMTKELCPRACRLAGRFS